MVDNYSKINTAVKHLKSNDKVISEGIQGVGKCDRNRDFSLDEFYAADLSRDGTVDDRDKGYLLGLISS